MYVFPQEVFSIEVRHCNYSYSSGNQFLVLRQFLSWRCENSNSVLLGQTRGGPHDLAKFRVPMIHRFMTSHPVAELLLCFRAKHEDGRQMPFGFLVIFTHRLTELCILNAEKLRRYLAGH